MDMDASKFWLPNILAFSVSSMCGPENIHKSQGPFPGQNPSPSTFLYSQLLLSAERPSAPPPESLSTSLRLDSSPGHLLPEIHDPTHPPHEVCRA